MDIIDEFYKDETGLEDQIEALLESEQVDIPEAERARYITSLGLKIQRTKADYTALHAKYSPLIERMRADLKLLKDKEERLEMLVSLVLPPSATAEYVDDHVRFFYLEDSKVRVLEPEKVPTEYCITKVEPSKTLIEYALEAGKEVPGAIRETTFSLQVKPGGPTGRKNAASRQRNLKKKALNQVN